MAWEMISSTKNSTKWTMNEDVFPIENWDIPVSYVTLPEGNLNKKLGGSFKDFLYFHPELWGR